MMYPDLTRVIEAGLRSEQRAPTGLLHCSKHAAQPLRFTQLEMVLGGEEKDFGDLMVLYTGTMFHREIENWVTKYLDDDWQIVGSEIDVTPYLPEGWTGTLDHLFLHVPTNTLSIVDIKTIKPEGIQYLTREPKEDHKIQVSCYHAGISFAPAQGMFAFDLDPEIAVYYLPKGRDSRNQTIMPRMTTTKALSPPAVWSRLSHIKTEVDAYVAEYERTGDVLNDVLAPMPEREMKMYWDRAKMQWDVKLVPHWSTMYNDYGPAYTPKQSSNLIGAWSIDGYYQPRKGYEHYTENDVPKPDRDEFRKRQQ